MNLDVLKTKKLLVGVSGSISVMGLPSYLSMFSYYFKSVKVIMTQSAVRLIPRDTVNLLCEGAYTDETELSKEASHVELARWADVFIVLPATANILGQAVHGLGNNLLTTAILAYPEPILYFPNMNERMWKKKSVQRNVKLLEQDGDQVVKPVQTMSYEVASGKMRPNYTIPANDVVMKYLYERVSGEQAPLKT